MKTVQKFFRRVGRKLGLVPPPRTYDQMTTQEVFTQIYDEGVWGAAGDGRPFFSGTGSHDPSIVKPYVAAVSGFLKTFASPPSVVDLGCGDFNVGSQIRPLCGTYIACDIVEKLLEFDRKLYAGLDVEFRALDLTRDPLPAAQIIFVREVFQHLSNIDILAAVPKIQEKFEYLILTELIPANPDFQPNEDKPRGHEVRMRVKSGVVLTAPPFNLPVHESTVLCEMPQIGGILRTLCYRLR